MSDVGGMFGRKEGGSLVVVVKLSGKLSADAFDELVAAAEDIKKKFPSLKVEVKRIPKAPKKKPAPKK